MELVKGMKTKVIQNKALLYAEGVLLLVKGREESMTLSKLVKEFSCILS